MAEIKKQKDGRYHTQIYLGKDINGKRIVKSIAGRTKKDVLIRIEEVTRKYNSGVDVAGGSATFEAWAERWLPYKANVVSERQCDMYRRMLNRLFHDFGKQAISEIQAFEIQAYIDELAAYNPQTHKPTSKRTLSCYKDLFSQIFEYAIMNRAMSFNPARYVKIPRSAPVKTRRALTPQERLWIEQTPHRMQTAAMIMLYAGLRRGEVLALTWDDVDLTLNTIVVNKAVSFVNGKPILKPPKTSAGNRTVYICDRLSEYLRSYRERAPDNKLVCPSLDGYIFTVDSFRNAWKSYQKELDVASGLNPHHTSKYDPRFKQLEIDNITPHMLRHTFCTMMYENGVSVKTAQSQMGHSSPTVTLSVYTHVTDEYSKQDMQKMNNISQ